MMGSIHRGWIRGPIVALLLAVVELIGPLGLVSVDAFTQANGVTWSIDHAAKTITADVRITLTAACSPNQQLAAAINPVGQGCTVTQEVADAIKQNIEQVWNNGNKYYCYDIVVHVDIKIDNKPLGDPSNRVLVRVDESGVAAVRSFVSGVQNAGAAWDSNAAGDELDPINNGSASSTWGYPARPNTYAHEAGHILGLNDGYEDYKGSDGKTYSRVRPGSVHDLMADTATAQIDKTNLRRMVERAGFKKTDLKCNYKIDQSSLGGKITGKKCDPLGGIWRAHGTYIVGRANGEQDWAIAINEQTKKGTFDYTDHQVADFIPGLYVTTDGTAFGDATLRVDDELNVHIHLQEQWHTYHATTAGGGRGNDQNADPSSADLEWQAIGKCP